MVSDQSNPHARAVQEMQIPLTAFALTVEMDESAEPTPTARLTTGMLKLHEDAYREFHTQYANRIFRYLLVLSRGQEQTASETLQDVLLRVVRYIRVFSDEKAFWSWLTVLARSAFRDRGRRWTRYFQMLSRFATQPPPIVPSEEEDTLATHLETVLQNLSSEDRDLIEQKYFAGRTARDLAAERGHSEKSMESRLLRIRRRLRNQLLELLKNET